MSAVLGMPDERVMLVRAQLEDGVSIGSGTLVGPRLVVTAAHVVFEENGEPSMTVKVGPPESELFVGTVVWPESYLADGASDDQDAALIEVTDEKWVPPHLGPIRWGWLTGRAPGVPCEAKGLSPCAQRSRWHSGFRSCDRYDQSRQPSACTSL